MSTAWIKVESSYAANGITNMVKSGNNSFVVGKLEGGGTIGNASNIHEFNIITNQWKPFYDGTFGTQLRYPSIGWNEHNKEIYIIGEYASNDKSDIIKIRSNCIEIEEQETFIGQRPNILFINNKLHVFCGSDNKDHLIWNDTNKEFEHKYTFNELDKGLMHHGVVYIHSKGVILMFGGFDYGTFESNDLIYQYSMHHKKWQLMDVKMPDSLNAFGYVLTSDEKYIIIIGGIEGLKADGTSNKIYVLEINTMQFYLSNIKCVQALDLTCSAVLINASQNNDHELIVSGYIRKECNEHGIIVPDEIVKLLIYWSSMEWIYVVFQYTKALWKIAVNDILSSIVIL